MKKYQSFLSENFQFLEVKFSIHFNRRVFVMYVTGGMSQFSLSLMNRLNQTDYANY